jgi:fimbrial chaperone protein
MTHLMLANRSKRLAFAALAVLLVALEGHPALAGSFQVNPIRVELDSRSTTQSLVIRNDAAEPLVVQLSLNAWQQADGSDVYTPTHEAIVTPPIAHVPPGGEQVVRVGLRRAPDPSRQLSYRLFVQEVAAPAAAGFAGLQVALRVGIPVFVAPQSAVKRELAWVASREGDGSLRLGVENRGNVHVQLVELVVRAPDHDEPIAHQQQLAYVLAGQSCVFVLPASWPSQALPGAVRVSAFGDAGDLDVTLPLAR